MLPKKISLASITFLLLLIAFDTLQQKYYVDTYNLGQGLDYTFLTLFKRHAVYWSIWLLINLPFGVLNWQWIKINPSLLTTRRLLGLSAIVFVSLALRLTAITFFALTTRGHQSINLVSILCSLCFKKDWFFSWLIVLLLSFCTTRPKIKLYNLSI